MERPERAEELPHTATGKRLEQVLDPGHPGGELAIARNRILDAVVSSRTLSTSVALGGGRKPSTVLAVEPDGDRFLSAGGLISGPGEVRVPIRYWEVSSGRCLRSFEGHSHRVCVIAMGRSGRRFYSGCAGGSVMSWDLGSGQGSLLHQFGKAVALLAESEETGRLAVLSYDSSQHVALLDLATGRRVAICEEVRPWSGGMRCLSVIGESLLGGHHDGRVSMWSLSSGKLIRIVGPFEGAVLVLGASGDPGQILAGTEAGTVWSCNVFTGAVEKLIHAPDSNVVGFSAPAPGMPLMVIAQKHEVGWWQTLCFSDLSSGRCLERLPVPALDQHCHFRRVRNAILTRDRRHVLIEDPSERCWGSLWNLDTQSPVRLYQVPLARVGLVAANPDGSLGIWSIDWGERLSRYEVTDFDLRSGKPRESDGPRHGENEPRRPAAARKCRGVTGKTRLAIQDHLWRDVVATRECWQRHLRHGSRAGLAPGDVASSLVRPKLRTRWVEEIARRVDVLDESLVCPERIQGRQVISIDERPPGAGYSLTWIKGEGERTAWQGWITQGVGSPGWTSPASAIPETTLAFFETARGSWLCEIDRLGTILTTKELEGPRTGPPTPTHHTVFPFYHTSLPLLQGERLIAILDKSVNVWNTATGCLVTTFHHNSPKILAVALSPCGGALLIGDQAGARLLELASGHCLLALDHDSLVASLAFMADRKQIVTGCDDGTIRFFDSRNGSLLVTLFNLDEAGDFMWLTPAREWWTNRLDLVTVFESGAEGEDLRYLADRDPRRVAYLAAQNNQRRVMTSLKGAAAVDRMEREDQEALTRLASRTGRRVAGLLPPGRSGCEEQAKPPGCDEPPLGTAVEPTQH